MKKVIPLVLSSALIVGGCATYTDDFYTPYPRSTSLQVGYHSGWLCASTPSGGDEPELDPFYVSAEA